MYMQMKRVFGRKDLFQAIAIVMLVFTPLIGGYWWWPIIVGVVFIMLALVHVLRRTPR